MGGYCYAIAKVLESMPQLAVVESTQVVEKFGQSVVPRITL